MYLTYTQAALAAAIFAAAASVAAVACWAALRGQRALIRSARDTLLARLDAIAAQQRDAERSELTRVAEALDGAAARMAVLAPLAEIVAATPPEDRP